MRRRTIVRGISYLTGLIVISFAVGLIIKVDIGAGAWDALNVGLSETFGFTVGTWVIVIGVLLIIINALLMKAKPDYFALLTIFILGPFIDFWLLFVFSSLDVNIAVRILFFALAVIILSLGISVYLQAKFAPVPIDNLMLAIQKLTGFSLMASKTIAEIVAMILAIIFSGPVGVGTVVIALLLGPCIQLFYPRVERLVKKYSADNIRYSK
jgi:uncharacterized membrane protein YczE